MIVPRNGALVMTLPRPRPPYRVGCVSRSPNKAPGGRIKISCAAPDLLDRFQAALSDGPHFVIGFDYVEADHGGRLTAMGGVGPQVVVTGDPAPGARVIPKRADGASFWDSQNVRDSIQHGERRKFAMAGAQLRDYFDGGMVRAVSPEAGCCDDRLNAPSELQPICAT